MVYRKRNYARRRRKRTYRRKRTIRRPRRRGRRPTKVSILRTLTVRQPFKCYRDQFGVAMIPTVSASFVYGAFMNIPRYNPGGSGSETLVHESRTNETVYMKSLQLKFSLITEYFPQHRFRIILLWNSEINEILDTVALTNLFEGTDFQPVAPSTAYNQLFIQHINSKLIRSKRDIVMDRTYTLNSTSTSLPNQDAATGRNSFKFNKFIPINKLMNFEVGTATPTSKYGNLYMIFLVSTSGTGTPAGNIYTNWNTNLYFMEK